MTVSPDGRVVIIGTGIAGATAAETLRKEGFTGSIVLVGDGPSPPYRRPMVSKEILAGADIAKAMLRPNAFWADNTIELHTGTSVESIEVDAARVVCEDGMALAYDALVIAAGDVARFPRPVLGGVQRIEHWNDSQAHGAAAARNALGIATAYEDVPWCWTTQFGRTVQVSGWPGAATEVVSYGDAAGDVDLARLTAGPGGGANAPITVAPE